MTCGRFSGRRSLVLRAGLPFSTVLGLFGGGLIFPSVTPASSSTLGSVALSPNAPGVKPNRAIQAVGWASRNWSGYAVTTGAPYSSLSANWIVPTVTGCSAGGRYPACYSAAWAGIDGFTNSNLIQTGTEQDFVNGSAGYSAWWTTSANGYLEQTIGISRIQGQTVDPCTNDAARVCGQIRPGDRMTANIGKNNDGTWTITLADNSTGHWSFTTKVAITLPGASAEWIMEAPTVRHIATLPNYNTFPFDPATANGTTPGLTPNDGGELVQRHQVVSIPSSPDSHQDGFAMAYGSVAPAPPSS